MDQNARRVFLIKCLLAQQPQYRDAPIPEDAGEQRRLLRALLNVRAPGEAGGAFLSVQDDYLQEELAQKGITDAAGLTPTAGGLCLWRGDITTLRCDAIVNAANSGMTGCYVPCHSCTDNCIHTFAGVQLRQGCAPIYPCAIHSTPDHFGADRSQAVIGVQMASAYVGTCLMPPLFGLIAAHISAALLPAYLLVILAVMVFMHETLLRRCGTEGKAL